MTRSFPPLGAEDPVRYSNITCLNRGGQFTAKLHKVKSDEERIQNYHDWGMTGFPGPLFPLNHFSRREIRIIYDALSEEFSHLPKEKASKYYLGN
jgi:hypothetical protein